MKKNGHPKIETGIPLPPRYHNKGWSALLRQLKPGQSVLLPGVSIQTATQLRKQIGGTKEQFTSRTIKGEGTRVWRIA